MNVKVAALAAAVVAAAAGCGSTAPSHASAAPVHTASAARAAGCGQVPLVVGTVRGELQNAPGGSTFAQASQQLAALGKSIPLGQLRSNVDLANVDLTAYWERVTSGEAANKWAAALAADLQRLDHECG